MKSLLRLTVAATLLAGIAWTWALPVQANGAPVRIILGYLPGVSNWGPTNATGIAEITVAEGEVSGSVIGLLPLTGEVYREWLVNTQTGEALAAGSFNANKEGATAFSYRLATEIPDRNWNLFLLAVEPEGRNEARPAERHSLAGYFPTSQQATERPLQLPRTGGDGAPGPAENTPLNIGMQPAGPPFPPAAVRVAGVALAGALALAAAAFWRRRRHQARRSRNGYVQEG